MCIFSTMICHAITPPVCDLDAFLGIDKETCTLYVPEVSIDLYKNADVWRDFFNIKGLSETGIGVISIVDDYTQSGIYDLSGRRLTKLQKGLNIVNGRKVLTW